MPVDFNISRPVHHRMYMYGAASFMLIMMPFLCAFVDMPIPTIKHKWTMLTCDLASIIAYVLSRPIILSWKGCLRSLQMSHVDITVTFSTHWYLKTKTARPSLIILIRSISATSLTS